MSQKKARTIAFYLPQFHPTPENDYYWGKGFTEWTNVAKSKPLFRGHQQPRSPADLGFYDLRLPQVREAQAELAKEAGIEGFCYWHYWFGNGKETLTMPLDEVVRLGKPDFPFCVCWANHDWTTKTWEKGKSLSKNSIIFKQEYLGQEDYTKFFYRLLPAFKDKRYIKVDGKLLFLIYNAETFENIQEFFSVWHELANKEGLNDFYFVAYAVTVPHIRAIDTFKVARETDNIVNNQLDKILSLGFSGVTVSNIKYAEIKAHHIIYKIIYGGTKRVFPELLVQKYDYKKIIKNFYPDFCRREDVYPQIIAGWDRSPRSGRKAVIYCHDTPENFGEGVKKALSCVENREPEHRLIFLNSWNEWGEGSYMEPDLRYGKGKLETLKQILENKNE